MGCGGGAGAAKNFEAAAKWCCEAAKQGHAMAKRDLRIINRLARVVEKGLAAAGLPYSAIKRVAPKYPAPGSVDPQGKARWNT